MKVPRLAFSTLSKTSQAWRPEAQLIFSGSVWGLPKDPQSLVVGEGPETQLQDTDSFGLVLSSETSKNLNSTTEKNFRMSQYEAELERDLNIDLRMGLIGREALEKKKMLTEVLRYGLFRRAMLKGLSQLCKGGFR